MRTLTVELYPDKVGEWRWRVKAENGNVLADGSEGYKNHGDCRAEVEELLTQPHEVNFVDAVEPRGQ